MKIALFCWEYPPFLVGGLGVYISNIAKKFVENGNDVSIFTLNKGFEESEETDDIRVYRPSFPNNSDAISLFANDDIKSWGDNINFFADIVSYNLFSAKKFMELAEKEKFDVIAVHDWLSAFSGIALKELNIPKVFHLHSVEEVRNPPGSETIKNLERKMANLSNKIITVSNSMKDSLISLNYEKEKISVCYNGCDPEIYNPKKVKPEIFKKLKEEYKIKDNNVIFYIGRLVWFKGIYNLIRSMPLILKEFPKTKLIMVGIGEDKEVSNLIQQLGLEKSIILKKAWITEEEKVAHYELSDVCVFPSIFEPFGIVASEAMAMEKPVVVGAARVSGFKEQVVPSGDNRTGVHVNGENPEDIAWGIKEVLRNLDEARNWGKNGRKRVLKDFTWDIAAKKTLSIYREIAK